ncbi:hypothetical protein C9I49_28085, partial [Pseudomonas prosekii]
GLPPFGCAAVVKPADAAWLKKAGAAAQPNGGEPPRHKGFVLGAELVGPMHAVPMRCENTRQPHTPW